MGDRRRKRPEPGSKVRLAHRRNDVGLSGITNKRGIFADAEPFGRRQRLRGERGTFAAGLIWLDRVQTNRELIWRCPGPLRSLKRKTGRRGPAYPSEKVRGGEIIPRTPLRRAIFVAGLAGAVVLALLTAFAR
jgi:hypothetical protein